LRILLTGVDGQVGWHLAPELQALGEVVATTRATLDLAQADSIRRNVRDSRPDVIVNPAGYTAVDPAESEAGLAMRINGEAPGVLGEEAKRLGALLVHYSSDYIFDGEKRTPYTEDDEPRPLNQYGLSKRAGEVAIMASGCRYLILRTSWVYGPRANNFYQFIRRKAEAGEAFAMVDDQTSVPTPGAFLAQYTLELVRRGASGLYHLVPSGQATRYEFARAVVETLGSPSRVEPASSDRFVTPARRPAYSVLGNERVAALLGRRLEHWRALVPK
jgi:dTDP-4-dehydrorhamnose reductase